MVQHSARVTAIHGNRRLTPYRKLRKELLQIIVNELETTLEDNGLVLLLILVGGRNIRPMAREVENNLVILLPFGAEPLEAFLDLHNVGIRHSVVFVVDHLCDGIPHVIRSPLKQQSRWQENKCQNELSTSVACLCASAATCARKFTCSAR